MKLCNITILFLLYMLFVRLATLNAKGLNEKEKQLAILQLLKEKRVNIALIQETSLNIKKRKMFRKFVGKYLLCF